MHCIAMHVCACRAGRGGGARLGKAHQDQDQEGTATATARRLDLTRMCAMEKMLASCITPPCRNAMHMPCMQEGVRVGRVNGVKARAGRDGPSSRAACMALHTGCCPHHQRQGGKGKLGH